MSLLLRTHTDVVMAALNAAGLTGYRGIGPSKPLSVVPYAVVTGGSSTTDGPSADLFADALAETQVMSVGAAADQAEWMADRVFDALVGADVSPPPGRRWLRPGAPIGHVLTRPVERDSDLGEGAPLFYVVQIFSLDSTPA